jgi:hypothetical protein
MIRWILGGAVYAGLWFAAAFVMVVAADRHLDVPTPYSIVGAPVAVLTLAALLLLCRESLLRRAVAPLVQGLRPDVVSRRRTHRRLPKAVRVAEGFVLLQEEAGVVHQQAA